MRKSDKNAKEASHFITYFQLVWQIQLSMHTKIFYLKNESNVIICSVLYMTHTFSRYI